MTDPNVTTQLECAIEAILFAAGEPVKCARLAAVLGEEIETVIKAAESLQSRYSFEKRGIRLVQMAGALQLCSSPEYASIIREVIETGKKPKLSQTALEVLACVAYFQPVTKAYVENLRGVDCGYTIGLLLERGLIETRGHLNAPGRPLIYATTAVFLRTFGISNISELPELDDLTQPQEPEEDPPLFAEASAESSNVPEQASDLPDEGAPL